MKNVILFLALILVSNNVFAQDAPQEKATNSEKEIIEKFFNLYEKDSEKALEYIYGTNKWINEKGDEVKNVQNQIKEFQKLVGDYLGYEYLTDAKLGKDFSTYIYLAKYDRQPIRFTFVFYKPRNEWFAYSFSFDDSFDDDFQEAIKYRYMNQF